MNSLEQGGGVARPGCSPPTSGHVFSWCGTPTPHPAGAPGPRALGREQAEGQPGGEAPPVPVCSPEAALVQ